MLSDFNFWNYLSKDSTKFKNVNSNGDDSIVRNTEIEELKDSLTKTGNEEIVSDTISKKEKVKQWGTYLLDVGKKATHKAVDQISLTAKQISLNVAEIGIIEESNLLRKFTDEQIKFIEEKQQLENRQKNKRLPWMDENNQDSCEQQTLKTKILSISNDDHNFLRNPPSGGDFEFNYELFAPMGRLLLTEDINLAKMRFKLVPKKISEESFWRNYFYRVFLLKQSLKSDNEVLRNVVDCDVAKSSNVDVASVVSGNSESDVNKVTIKKEAPIIIDNDEWEAELQKELSEFELINDIKSEQEVNYGDDNGEFDDLEREILNELEK